ncbi:hypothetical protein R3I93_022402 [Phoxinus phoxinus]|uniref:Uncharacterized protein n=1 Tax=Phoxinus phoxinus TaxID=58324 RepID=A0AAN9GQ75_9TELE
MLYIHIKRKKYERKHHPCENSVIIAVQLKISKRREERGLLGPLEMHCQLFSGSHPQRPQTKQGKDLVEEPLSGMLIKLAGG